MTETIGAYHPRHHPIPDGWEQTTELPGFHRLRFVWIEPMAKRNPIAGDEAARPRPSAGAHKQREPVPRVCPSCYGAAVIDAVQCSLCEGEGEVYE